jgi:hypothetical protein
MQTPSTCFNTTTLSLADQRELQSYDILNGNIFGNHEKITDLAVFGQDYHCLAKLQADLLILVLFFKMIYNERIFDVSQGNVYAWDYYSDKYCMEKIKSAFYCRNVIIDELEKLWSLWGFNIIGEDGIGKMQVEGTGVTHPIFRVRE